MNFSHRALNELIGREGFTQLTVEELFRSAPLIDVLTEKVSSLQSWNFVEKELEQDVRVLLDIIRESLARRYSGLSLLAFAHILVALDHFVRVKDHRPDTHLGGYVDDLTIVRSVVTDFHSEIDRFKRWKQRLET